MVVYLDIIFLTNFILDISLLLACGMIFRVHCRWYRLLLGGGIGALYAVLCASFNLRFITLSVAAAFLQTAAVYRAKHIQITAGYIGLSCAAAGVMLLFPAHGFALCVSFAAALLASVFLARYFESGIRVGRLKRKVEISFGGKSVLLDGFVDSGNRMHIAVINEKSAAYLIGKDEVLRMKEMRLGNYSLCPCRTVAGDSVIPVFEPEDVKIDGRSCALKVGVIFGTMSDEVLLPKEFIFKENHYAESHI